LPAPRLRTLCFGGIPLRHIPANSHFVLGQCPCQLLFWLICDRYSPLAVGYVARAINGQNFFSRYRWVAMCFPSVTIENPRTLLHHQSNMVVIYYGHVRGRYRCAYHYGSCSATSPICSWYSLETAFEVLSSKVLP